MERTEKTREETKCLNVHSVKDRQKKENQQEHLEQWFMLIQKTNLKVKEYSNLRGFAWLVVESVY